MADRTHDLVLFGATGFTGKLVAEYVATHAPRTFPELRWAIAGRSQSKLEDVRRDVARMDPKLADLPILIADAADAAALEDVARSTKVVCTTVGPYASYGHALAAACADAGTDYCDLTGEVHFVRDCIDRLHRRAMETHARLVNCSGFDSIPSDLGTYLLYRYFADQGQKFKQAKFVIGKTSGGVSGGTIASMLHMLALADKDPNFRKLAANPYALCPDPADRGPDKRDQTTVVWDEDIKKWTAPFVMAAINTRVVRRTNALLDYPYGKDFRYSEVTGFPQGPKGLAMATGLTAGLGAFLGLAVPKVTRNLLTRVLPKPGEGPSKEARDKGFFEAKVYGWAEGDNKPSAMTVIEGRADPGYGETAKMLSESALELVRTHSTRTTSGVLTPASALGMALVERLRAADMRFQVLPIRV